MIQRRGFLGGFAALLAAPAVVKAESLMRLAPPILWADGLHDDTPALQAMIDQFQRDVDQGIRPRGSRFRLPAGFLRTDSLLKAPGPMVIDGNRFGPKFVDSGIEWTLNGAVRLKNPVAVPDYEWVPQQTHSYHRRTTDGSTMIVQPEHLKHQPVFGFDMNESDGVVDLFDAHVVRLDSRSQGMLEYRAAKIRAAGVSWSDSLRRAVPTA